MTVSHSRTVEALKRGAMPFNAGKLAFALGSPCEYGEHPHDCAPRICPQSAAEDFKAGWRYGEARHAADVMMGRVRSPFGWDRIGEPIDPREVARLAR